MGGKLLRTWMLQPLQRVEDIKARLDTVAFFASPTIRDTLSELRKTLSKVANLEVRVSMRLPTFLALSSLPAACVEENGNFCVRQALGLGQDA